MVENKKTKEYKSLIRILRLHPCTITYDENKVIFHSRDQKKSRSAYVPNELQPTIEQLFDSVVPEDLIEFDKIGPYILGVLFARFQLDYAVSSPKEREIKDAIAQYFRQDIEQKHKEFLEDMIRRFLRTKKE